MQQLICCLFPFFSMGQIPQLFPCWVVVKASSVALSVSCLWKHLVDGGLVGMVFGSEGPLSTSEMPTIMTSETEEAFQRDFVSHFANTSSF